MVTEDDDRIMLTSEGELLIEDVTKRDMGEYECVATRGMDHVNSTTSFEVYGELQ